jgi:hypothetical protein
MLARLYHWQIYNIVKLAVLASLQHWKVCSSFWQMSVLIVGHLKELPLAWPWAPFTPVAAEALAGRPVRNPFFSRCPVELLALNGLRAGRAIF